VFDNVKIFYRKSRLGMKLKGDLRWVKKQGYSKVKNDIVERTPVVSFAN
jgi:hypothetical protein